MDTGSVLHKQAPSCPFVSDANLDKVRSQLTSFLARTANETLKSFPMDQHYYRSASNSLLARTADGTPKTFAFQGDPSRSTFPPSYKRSPYIVSPVRP
ncbi:hypothetical protein AVEN_67648-1 [Araneus ventricosus]|uniref:Uncharacterized protein n=1 Tax=Araneus ventricosus TaxID=182803 RepID=A0A4Y2SVC9_ARAVE|nr:hypothetical protein AVEN_67648-1 [Araneus ventricosus]